MHRQITTDLIEGHPDGCEAILFSSASGIEVRADTMRPYDGYGVSVRHVGPVTTTMFGLIKLWVADLLRLSGRTIEAIVLCSVWRHPPAHGTSRHCRGQAIDVGGIWWDADDGVTAWGYTAKQRTAVAIEATMRLSFGTVLGPTSNLAHMDHWHCDIGRRCAITQYELVRSARGKRMVDIVWLQEACSVVHGRPLKRDGIWGRRTAAAVTAVLSDTHHSALPQITEPSVYESFCLLTAERGFGAA